MSVAPGTKKPVGPAGPARGVADRGRAGLRHSRLAVVFLAASVMAHAAIIGYFPAPIAATDAPPVALEVTLAQPQPLPVAPREPERVLQQREAVELPPTPRKIVKPPPRPVPPAATPKPRASETVLSQAPSLLALRSSDTPDAGSSSEPVPLLTDQGEREPAAARPTALPMEVALAQPTSGASYLSNPAPRYPLAARRAGEQGTVTLRVLVSADGQSARVELERSSGSVHLDSAALEAVKGWRFMPARRGGVAIEGWILVPIVFRLEG